MTQIEKKKWGAEEFARWLADLEEVRQGRMGGYDALLAARRRRIEAGLSVAEGAEYIRRGVA